MDERGWQSRKCGWMEEREGEIATCEGLQYLYQAQKAGGLILRAPDNFSTLVTGTYDQVCSFRNFVSLLWRPLQILVQLR
jgi:hypothetical protein